MELKNITDLKLLYSFYQINLIKGYKYIDKAGEIVNLYCKEVKPPDFDMGLSGLNIKHPTKYIEVIKYSSDRMWIKFINTDTVDQVAQFIKEPISIIKDVQEIKNVSRIGIRNIFLLELDNINDISTLENKINIISNTNTILFRFSHSKNQVNSITDIELLVNKNDNRKKALQVNSDVFIKENIEIDNVIKKTKDILDYFKQDIPGLVNSLFGVK